jgi:uncharacterized protein involved in response to NO
MIVYRLYIIYKTGRISQANSDPFWIMIGFGMSLLSHLLFFAYYISDIYALYTLSVEVGFYLYLVFLAFAVGQRMIPFFSHYMGAKAQYFTLIVFMLLLLKSFDSILGLTYFEVFVDMALAFYLLQEFLRWKLPIFQSPPILWILHLALFWMPAAFFLGGLATLTESLTGNSFAALQVHLLAIGFLTTVLIGFGTRVTLGHSGQPPHADGYATNLFWLIQLLVVIRALYSLQMGAALDLFWIFDLSMTLWILLFILWTWRFGAVLYSGKKLSS